MKFLTVILLSLCFSSCLQQSEPADKETQKGLLDSLNITEKQISNSPFIKSDSIFTQDYKLKIISSWVKEEIDTPSVLFNNCVLNQTMIFFSKDIIANKILFPVKKLNVKTVKGENLEIQENNIYEISIVTGNKGWFYKVSGGGIIGSQSEYYGAYSPDGKLLWYSYTSYQNYKNTQPGLPDEGFGDIDKVLGEYGISEQEFNKPSKSIEINL